MAAVGATKLKAVPTGYGKTYRRFECGLEGYEGFELEAWSNPPMKLLKAISRAAGDADEAAFADVLRERPFIRSWNLVDFEGAPVPLPDDEPEALDELPAPLYNWVLECLATAPSNPEEEADLKAQSPAT